MRENGHIYQATHWEGADEDEIADVRAKGLRASHLVPQHELRR